MSQTRNKKKKIYSEMYQENRYKPSEDKKRSVRAKQREYTTITEYTNQGSVNNVIFKNNTYTIKKRRQSGYSCYKPRDKRKDIQQHREEVQKIPKYSIKQITYRLFSHLKIPLFYNLRRAHKMQDEKKQDYALLTVIALYYKIHYFEQPNYP